MLCGLICLSVARVRPMSQRFLSQDRPGEPGKAETCHSDTATEPPRLDSWETFRKIIGEQVGIVLLQEALQPGAGHSATRQGENPAPGTKLLPVSRPELSDLQKHRTETISEQSPGLIDKFYCIAVGIIAFMERAGSMDIETEAGLADMVGVQEIQHGADRLRGFP
jgi:hypothetical protein